MKKLSKRVSRAPVAQGGKKAAGAVRTVASRPVLVRMQKIHAVLAEGKYPNAVTLGRLLEVDPKTIRRDMEYMRDQMDYPIEYDESRRGFYYSEPVANFPLMKATEGELLALLVARQALQAYEGTPYAQVLEKAFGKLASMLGDEVSVAASDLTDAVSFRSEGVGILDAALYASVSKAVLERREAEFDYTKPDHDTERRRVQPYHLAWMNRESYLIAHDLDRGALRMFKLARMADFEVTRHRFTRDPDFSPEKFFRDSFGLMGGGGAGEVRRVRVWFSSYGAQLARERVWHKSQKLRELPGGEMEMELRVGNLDEIKRWVLRYCGEARALEPPELVKAVRDDARRIAKAHSGTRVNGEE